MSKPTIQLTPEEAKAEEDNPTKHLLLGMGNPLLCLHAESTQRFLDQRRIDHNFHGISNANDIFEEKELKEKPWEYFAGGATLESIRCAQWILHDKPNCTAYFGCIGSDDHAKTLKEKVAGDHITGKFQVTEESPTGTSTLVCTGPGNNRCLKFVLDAGEYFSIDFLDSEGSWELVEESTVIYSAGYFVKVCDGAMIRLGMHAAQCGKYFASNLSEKTLLQYFNEEIRSVLKCANLVFGNGNEADYFAKKNELGGEDRQAIAKKIAEMPLVEGHKFRIVCITQGAEPVILVDETGEVKTFEVPAVPENEIVDHIGTGDAFVGGFLSQLALKKSLPDCVKCGIWAAGQVLRKTGCTFPDKRYEETVATLPQE